MGDCKNILKDTHCRKFPDAYANDCVVEWFDGVTDSSGNNCGSGGLIRNSEHRCYKSYFNCGTSTNTKEELLGALALLTLASYLSIVEIHIKGVSKIIIECLKGKGHLQVVALECWKDRINETTKFFQKISFAHVYREGNTAVDNLSKCALHQSPGQIVYFMCEEDHEGPY
jgi:ribonuclease HI